MTKLGKFLKLCSKYVGLPYIWGGENPAIGLDCSGYIQIILAEYGLDPSGDQTADNLKDHFMTPPNGLLVPNKDMRPGDLLFFGAHHSKMTHVAIVAGEGLMFEAGGGNKFCTTPAYAKAIGACVRLTNIDRRSDLVYVIRPLGLSLEG